MTYHQQLRGPRRFYLHVVVCVAPGPRCLAFLRKLLNLLCQGNGPHMPPAAVPSARGPEAAFSLPT